MDFFIQIDFVNTKKHVPHRIAQNFANYFTDLGWSGSVCV